MNRGPLYMKNGLNLFYFVMTLASGLLLIGSAEAAPPRAPTSLRAVTSADGASIRLSWNSVSGATAYEVLKRSGKDAPLTAPSRTVTFLSASTRTMSDYAIEPYNFYTYTVRAVNSGKEVGAESNRASSRGWTTLTAPKSVFLQSDQPSSLKASWARADHVEYYLAYWNNVKCLGSATRVSGQETSSRRSATSLNTGITFSIQAVNFAGNKSACSAWTEKVYPLPPAPSSVKIVLNSAKQPVITWTGVSGATNYRISRIQQGNSAQFLTTISEDGRTRSYTDRAALRYRTTYRYSISTSSPGGISTETTSSNSITTPEAPIPRPVSALQVTVSGTTASLTWTASPDTPNAQVYRQIGTAAKTFLTTVTISKHTDSGPLPYNTDVLYSVRALNDNKESTTEVSQTVRVAGNPIADAPTSFAVKELFEDNLVLSWTMGARSTGTKIYRWLDGETPTLVATLGNVTQYVDSGNLKPSSTYYFQARSTNSNGDGLATAPLQVKTSAFRNFYSVRISWAANRESAVNQTGGGYRVLICPGTIFDRTKAQVITVPYVSGAEAPTSTTLSEVRKGSYRVRVEAYSSSIESVSGLSQEIAVQVPAS